MRSTGGLGQRNSHRRRRGNGVQNQPQQTNTHPTAQSAHSRRDHHIEVSPRYGYPLKHLLKENPRATKHLLVPRRQRPRPNQAQKRLNLRSQPKQTALVSTICSSNYPSLSQNQNTKKKPQNKTLIHGLRLGCVAGRGAKDRFSKLYNVQVWTPNWPTLY
jgi:hypothetical protein